MGEWGRKGRRVTYGAWVPASLWREQKEAKRRSSLVRCRAPALGDSSRSGSRRREPANSPAGVEKATSFRAPATSPFCPFSAALGTGARVHGIGSPGPGPTRPPLGGRARLPVVGQTAPAGSVPCLCWDMAAAEATPPTGPGEPRAARWASQAACPASVASAASLEGCWRPAGAGPRQLSVPQTHPADYRGPSSQGALPRHRA